MNKKKNEVNIGKKCKDCGKYRAMIKGLCRGCYNREKGFIKKYVELGYWRKGGKWYRPYKSRKNC